MSFRKIFPPTTSKSAVSISRAATALSQKLLRESRARRAQRPLTGSAGDSEQQQADEAVGEIHGAYNFSETGWGEISD